MKRYKSEQVRRFVGMCLCAFLLTAALFAAAGCRGKTGPAPQETTTGGTSMETMRLPDTDPGTDAFFAAAAGTAFTLPLQQGDLSLSTGKTLPDKTRLHTPLFFAPNRMLAVGLDKSYRVMVCMLDAAGNQNRTPVADGTLWYLQKNARWAFVLERIDGGEITEAEAAMLTVTLLDPDAVAASGHGLWNLSPVWGVSDSYGGWFSLQPGEQVSAPLPLSDGGLGVLFGGDEVSAAHTFRTAAFRLTDDGIVPAEDACLQAMAGKTLPAQSLYLPETADCYAVLILEGSTDPALLTLTGGKAEVTDQNRLGGLFNMNIRLDKGENGTILQMIQYRAEETLDNQEYLGALLQISDVQRITCDPRYELTATVWVPDAEGTLKRVKTIWNGVQPGGNTPRGFSTIVPAQSDNGFLLLCVHRRAEPIQTAAGDFAVKSRGMGAMRGYEEVSAGVTIDYMPGCIPQVIQFDNPILTQNLHDIASISAPYVYGGVYSTPQHPEEESPFSEMTDLSPVWYNGRFTANTYLHHVTPRSYLTAAANPNSRYYVFSKPQGYGSTCMGFSMSVFGLTEEYSMSQLWKGETLKFERAPFSFETDLDALLPGDLLLQIDPVSRVGHLMVVDEMIRKADETLFSVSVVEGYPPFSRQRTFYLTGAPDSNSSVINACSPVKLKNYSCRLRIRPEYIRSLRDSFDMTPDLTTGTVMCDRGSDSIYCIGAQIAEMSVTDETANVLRFYRDGDYAGSISLVGAERRNGCRVVDFSHLITAPGLYTVFTDTSEEKQESFFVPAQEPAFQNIRISSDADGKTGSRLIVAADLSHIDSIMVYYKRKGEKDPEDPRPQYYVNTYPAEAIAPADASEYGEGWGCVTAPETWEDKTFSSVFIIYRTAYGKFRLGYSKNGLMQTADV